VFTSKVGHSFIGETEEQKTMTADTFALSAKMLLKLTKGLHQRHHLRRPRHGRARYVRQHVGRCPGKTAMVH